MENLFKILLALCLLQVITAYEIKASCTDESDIHCEEQGGLPIGCTPYEEKRTCLVESKTSTYAAFFNCYYYFFLYCSSPVPGKDADIANEIQRRHDAKNATELVNVADPNWLEDDDDKMAVKMCQRLSRKELVYTSCVKYHTFMTCLAYATGGWTYSDSHTKILVDSIRDSPICPFDKADYEST